MARDEQLRMLENFKKSLRFYAGEIKLFEAFIFVLKTKGGRRPNFNQSFVTSRANYSPTR